MKLHNKLFVTGVVATSLLTFTACNDFLELEPPSDVTPEAYFQNDEQLGAYAIARYADLFTTPSGWGQGNIINADAATDNMAATSPNSSRFTKHLWTVPHTQDGGLGFEQIRYCNYFFQQVLPRYESGFYSSYPNAEHYIGEMYFLRAWVYYSRLRTYGDYPIVTDVLTDNKEDLMAHGTRMPRNEVADFILSDLDKAIELLNDKGFLANNRINKQVALLVKSRVALYEASYERYHKGSGRVPGDPDWPGYSQHPGYEFNVENHVTDLLTQAMEAAKEVADNIQLTENTMVLDQNPASPGTGWNPYFEMYASMDLSGVDEVLMWRDYGTVGTSTVQHGVPAYIASSGGIGLLKGYVESFLMANGLPIYATGSGYHGDVTLDDVKADRDGRLQLFVFGESNYLPFTTNDHENIYHFSPVMAPARTDQMGDVTGYRIRKGQSFDWQQNSFGDGFSETAQIVFRGTEALLNYMEAQYMRDGSLDATSQGYWRAIRTRAGVDTDFQKTINATNMSEEAKGDWGAYSTGNLLSDRTLYNIRRERRCEFVGEGMRWDDLVRWCAMDQLVNTPYMPEGVNFWTSMYQTATTNEMHATVTYVEGPDDPDANISSSAESVYIRPYRINSGNNVFDGYTWMNAHYNSPLPIREIQLLSPDENVDTSVLYQTWGWPTESSLPAEK